MRTRQDSASGVICIQSSEPATFLFALPRRGTLTGFVCAICTKNDICIHTKSAASAPHSFNIYLLKTNNCLNLFYSERCFWIIRTSQINQPELCRLFFFQSGSQSRRQAGKGHILNCKVYATPFLTKTKRRRVDVWEQETSSRSQSAHYFANLKRVTQIQQNWQM